MAACRKKFMNGFPPILEELRNKMKYDRIPQPLIKKSLITISYMCDDSTEAHFTNKQQVKLYSSLVANQRIVT